MSVKTATKCLTIATLLCASCGGAAVTTAPPSTAASAATPPPGSVVTETSVVVTDTPQDGTVASSGGRMHVRFLNLYAPADHPTGVSLNGFLEGDESPATTRDGTGTPDFPNVAYGQVSDFKAADVSVVGDIALFVAGQPQPVSTANINGATEGRITIVVYSIGQPGFAASEGFNETPSQTDVDQKMPNALSAAPSGKALIVAVGGPLQVITDRKGFNLGQPGKGCFDLQVPDGPNDGQTNIPSGGSLTYVTDPGALQIAFFADSDGDCSQTPVIPPVAVSLGAGDRTYVVAYGTTASTQLLSMDVPIAAFPDDQPLIPSPPAVTTAPPASIDACSTITNDQAAAALGAPVDSSNGDATQGSCIFTAGDATLSVAIQADIPKEAFAAFKSGANGESVPSDIGDDAFFTSDPDSIVVLKGTTMLAIGLDHHADTGADDPAVDNPLISALAIDALQNL